MRNLSMGGAFCRLEECHSYPSVSSAKHTHRLRMEVPSSSIECRKSTRYSKSPRHVRRRKSSAGSSNCTKSFYDESTCLDWGGREDGSKMHVGMQAGGRTVNRRTTTTPTTDETLMNRKWVDRPVKPARQTANLTRR